MVYLSALSAGGTYLLFGTRVRSPWNLPCPDAPLSSPPDVEFVEVTEPWLSAPEQNDNWFQYEILADGSEFLRWKDLYEFRVSPDGRRISCRALKHGSLESLWAYLLGQVLSFALLRLGKEPLHATAVVTGGRAVAFTAHPGGGKSTLAAAFLRRGDELLTDDLLVAERRRGAFVAYAGIPRLKLFPETADALLPDHPPGTVMNPATTKRIYPLQPASFFPRAAPLHRIYLLREKASGRPTVRTLPPRRAFLDVVANSFNVVVSSRERMERQMRRISELISGVPTKSITYVRDPKRLAEVVDVILRDLG